MMVIRPRDEFLLLFCQSQLASLTSAAFPCPVCPLSLTITSYVTSSIHPSSPLGGKELVLAQAAGLPAPPTHFFLGLLSFFFKGWLA
ncbi:hypothetical protein B0J18DRAFT_437861 [Chaetomium sp. MPI-SDFR-AT-0129]|nr:hypothetical protein B0J18DRAFT_437861 [Chaetomium sp. MPI-SDFR-AT-0129]